MKFLLVQRNPFVQLGTSYIAAAVKSAGYTCNLIVANLEKNYLESIKLHKPDVVGFSCTTGSHLWALGSASEIKKVLPDVTVIMGGPHPTYYPEVIEESGIDIICRGEGEIAIVELLNRLQSQQEITNINNLWIKQNNRIFKNDVGDLVEDLDEIHMADRSIYDHYPILKKVQGNMMSSVITGRGCPFSCTFCFNDPLKKIYKDKGCYCRRRSVGNVIDEILQMKKKYPLEKVIFTDDLFVQNKEWIYEFCKHYKEQVDLPFYCIIRADGVDESCIKALKRAGCVLITLGVESGCDHMRNSIMKKKISTQQIVETCRLVKKNGILLQTLNILGLPGETLEDAFKTIQLNIDVDSDFPSSSVLQPYLKTRMFDYCVSEGYLNKSDAQNIANKSFYMSSPLRMQNIKVLENVQKFFWLACKFPRLHGVIKVLVKAKPNFAFSTLFKICYAFALRSIKKDPVGDAFAIVRKTSYF